MGESVIPGHDRRTTYSNAQSRLRQCADGVDAKIGPRRARLENSRQFDVERGDCDVHRQPVRLRHLRQHIEIANHQVRLGDDAQLKAAVARKFFKNGARDLVAAFGRLVGIGCSPQRDRFVPFHAPQVVAEQPGSMLLDVNLLLELHAIAHLHELVRVAGIAVAASELAAAIRIDRPGERHLAITDAPIQQRLGRKREVLDVVPFAQRFAFRRQSGNANQLRLIRKREQGLGSHIDSPFVRPRIAALESRVKCTRG